MVQIQQVPRDVTAMAVEWQDLLPEGLVDIFFKLAASETST